MTAHLRCLSCNAKLPAAEHYSCPECGGELDVQYDHDRIREDGRLAQSWRQSGPMAERFAELMPLAAPESAVSLGEGNTPLVRSHNLARRLGLRHLYFKLEGSNPTGSFKDRQVAIAISKARELGRRRFATVSSGNVGNALAAYAAHTGGRADIWVSHETAEAKRQQIEIYGAQVFLLPSPRGDGGPGPYFSALKGLPDFCARHGLVPMISARPINPYMVEGAKAIGYEIAATLGRNPDVVFAPVGGGGLAGGVFKRFPISWPWASPTRCRNCAVASAAPISRRWIAWMSRNTRPAITCRSMAIGHGNRSRLPAARSRSWRMTPSVPHRVNSRGRRVSSPNRTGPMPWRR